MPVPRFKLACPWCGAKLKTMDTADRIREKRAPGSKIEKSVAKCPQCSRIVFLKGPPPRFGWRQAKLWGAGALALAVVIGLVIVAFLMRGQ
jgi:DNA-directed RNA polymerase subunit RPC12/RpoP